MCEDCLEFLMPYEDTENFVDNLGLEPRINLSKIQADPFL